jgi:hypothetical protein
MEPLAYIKGFQYVGIDPSEGLLMGLQLQYKIMQ